MRVKETLGASPRASVFLAKAIPLFVLLLSLFGGWPVQATPVLNPADGFYYEVITVSSPYITQANAMAQASTLTWNGYIGQLAFANNFVFSIVPANLNLWVADGNNLSVYNNSVTNNRLRNAAGFVEPGYVVRFDTRAVLASSTGDNSAKQQQVNPNDPLSNYAEPVDTGNGCHFITLPGRVCHIAGFQPWEVADDSLMSGGFYVLWVPAFRASQRIRATQPRGGPVGVGDSERTFTQG